MSLETDKKIDELAKKVDILQKIAMEMLQALRELGGTNDPRPPAASFKKMESWMN